LKTCDFVGIKNIFNHKYYRYVKFWKQKQSLHKRHVKLHFPLIYLSLNWVVWLKKEDKCLNKQLIVLKSDISYTVIQRSSWCLKEEECVQKLDKWKCTLSMTFGHAYTVVDVGNCLRILRRECWTQLEMVLAVRIDSNALMCRDTHGVSSAPSQWTWALALLDHSH